MSFVTGQRDNFCFYGTQLNFLFAHALIQLFIVSIVKH